MRLALSAKPALLLQLSVLIPFGITVVKNVGIIELSSVLQTLIHHDGKTLVYTILLHNTGSIHYLCIVDGFRPFGRTCFCPYFLG